jgi:hypothetical protein
MSAGYEQVVLSPQISLVCKLVIVQQMHLTQIFWSNAGKEQQMLTQISV